MKRSFRLTTPQTFIAGLVLLLAIAGGAFYWAMALNSSLSDYHSPLLDQAPKPGQALGQPATRKVVFILVDALRLDTSLQAATMPTLNQLRRQGASATMHSRPPSFSEPGYSTLLTGAWPALNSGPVMNLDYADIPTWTQDNLFSAVHRAHLKTAVSGFNWFEKLIPQDAVDLHFYTAGEDQKADQEVQAAALPWLDQNASLVLIHVDQVDYAGHHEGGPRSPAWAAAAQRADQIIATVLARLDLTQDTLFVCSDHGQIDAGGHGGTEAVVLTEPWVLAGVGVKPGQYGDVNMVDVAPTLAALLGANLPASTQGQVRQEMLTLPAASLAALPAAEQAQQKGLLEAFTRAINHPLDAARLPKSYSVEATQAVLEGAAGDRLYLERVPRWLIFGFVLLLVASVLTRFSRRALAWAFGGALVSQLVFHGLYFFIAGHVYSLSGVISVVSMVQDVGILMAISLLAGWLVVMWGSGAFRLARGAALLVSFGYTLALICLLLLPIGFYYAIHGALVTWTLPDIGFFYIAMLFSILVGFTAVLSILLASLTLFIARKPGTPT